MANLPYTLTYAYPVGPFAANASTATQTMGEVPIAGTVTGVRYVRDVAESLEATNYITWSVVNKGQAGAGSGAVASATSNNTGGSAITAFDAEPFTLGADLTVAAGDVLAFTRTPATGTSTADKGVVYVDVQATA